MTREERLIRRMEAAEAVCQEFRKWVTTPAYKNPSIGPVFNAFMQWKRIAPKKVYDKGMDKN